MFVIEIERDVLETYLGTASNVFISNGSVSHLFYVFKTPLRIYIRLTTTLDEYRMRDNKHELTKTSVFGMIFQTN